MIAKHFWRQGSVSRCLKSKVRLSFNGLVGTSEAREAHYNKCLYTALNLTLFTADTETSDQQLPRQGYVYLNTQTLLLFGCHAMKAGHSLGAIFVAVHEKPELWAG
jgi:hypothetical protein